MNITKDETTANVWHPRIDCLIHRIYAVFKALCRHGGSCLFLSPDVDFLFLEVSLVLLVNENQVHEMLHGELVVYILVARSQVGSCQVESDGDALVLEGLWSLKLQGQPLTFFGTTVHHLVFD